MNCSFAGMNYLGHAYLSFDSPPIVVGNMISDFVKGSSRFMFSGNIQKGIMLHRAIDAFTDEHPATKKAMEVFRPEYRLYSAPIMDIVYDHFLALELQKQGILPGLAQRTYRYLEEYSADLPPRFLFAFTYMKTENWLYHYQFHDGLRKSLHGLVRRSRFLRETDTAFEIFIQHNNLLEECSRQFFTDVKQFAKQKFDELDLTT